jgi:L-lactate dehydrogenase complex protein LldE
MLRMADPTQKAAQTPPQNPRVALLVTCLVDLVRPQIAFAAIELLERAGCIVSVPEEQTCCGQPAYNSGDRADAQAIAKQVIETFSGCDYVVAPSGSCTGMVRAHFPELFVQDPVWGPKAMELAARTFELTQFLVDVMGRKNIVTAVAAMKTQTALYHDSCSGLRELGVKTQPRALLAAVPGLKTKDYSGSETCCGFGGTFCVKYPDVSDRIVAQRVTDLSTEKADLVLGGDLGCLMNLAGKLSREGSPLRVFHIAEVLAGKTDEPAIGEQNGLASPKIGVSR